MIVTILMPCLNEEKTIKEAILEIQKEIKKLPNSIETEIVVVDNGSEDNSIKIAKDAGARVIKESIKGYGSALQRGILEAKGDIVIFGDCDCSYRFSYMKEFINKIQEGADLVVGNRFKGTIEKGAMPFLHRYIGTPFISWLGRVLYGIKISDFNCGLRGLKRNSILQLKLNCKGMEYASEMIIKAQKNNLEIEEIPIDFYCDKRERKPHLRMVRDGIRHFSILFRERGNI